MNNPKSLGRVAYALSQNNSKNLSATHAIIERANCKYVLKVYVSNPNSVDDLKKVLNYGKVAEVLKETKLSQDNILSFDIFESRDPYTKELKNLEYRIGISYNQ